MKYQEALELWAQRKFPDRKIINAQLDVSAETDYGCCDDCTPSSTLNVEFWYWWEDDTQPKNPSDWIYVDLESFLHELFELTEGGEVNGRHPDHAGRGHRPR